MFTLPNHFAISLLPGIDRITKEHKLAGQQPDNLCGPYWAAILLRAYGFSSITAEQVAQLAGSVLPIGDPATWLPEGASSRQDYCITLPHTSDLSNAGTSAQGLIAAADALSNHTYQLVPLQTDWTADRLEAVLNLCQSHPAWSAIPLCNIRTAPLWGSGLAVSEAIAYLEGQTIEPPSADWNVGHFLALAGTVTGKSQSLILTCDTYPRFGWQGYHLQPATALARALNRDDGYGGGILLFVASSDRLEVEQQAKEKGFAIEAWDNGSPKV
jgi:hypothetical protein